MSFKLFKLYTASVWPSETVFKEHTALSPLDIMI